MVRPLPFDGYSWQISQHEIRFDEKPLFGLLGTAALFEGRTNYSSALNHALASFSFVTENVREGKVSPWRDYQQVLPEMGLIISTKVLRAISITEIGRSFLAGSISHTDLMTLQLMRYQYPNGYKSDTLAEFQHNKAEVRPGLMIFRGLIELQRKGVENLSVAQIVSHFLPNRTDLEWSVSVDEMLSEVEIRTTDIKVRRNVTAWVRLLGKTRFMDSADGQLVLSDTVKSELARYSDLADHLIAQPLWQPADLNRIALDWFSYFGSFRSVDPKLENEIERNSPEVGTIQDHLELGKTSGGLSLQLVDFSPINLSLASLPQATDALFQSYLSGQAKIQFAKQEHDKLVNSIAEFFAARGWSIRHDSGSVDLLAINPKQEARIIEVKTTTQKTMSKQVRTGVGQVLEYKYRYNRDHPPTNTCDIIVNRAFAGNDWHREFCGQNDINLDCFSEGQFLFSRFD